jgi:hypothetical protein
MFQLHFDTNSYLVLDKVGTISVDIRKWDIQNLLIVYQTFELSLNKNCQFLKLTLRDGRSFVLYRVGHRIRAREKSRLLIK